MTVSGWIQILVFTALVVAVTHPLGGYMTRVFSGERTLLAPVLGPVERRLYRLAGVVETAEPHWVNYAVSMLLFSVVALLLLHAMQRLQGGLPFNPAGMTALPADLAFNTAASFTT